MKSVNWSAQGQIPGLLFFQNGGEFTGSINDFGNKDTKEFRYKIESNSKEREIKVMVWYGPFCYDKSEVVDHAEFSLDDDGRNDMLGWMKEKYENMIE